MSHEMCCAKPDFVNYFDNTFVLTTAGQSHKKFWTHRRELFEWTRVRCVFVCECECVDEKSQINSIFQGIFIIFAEIFHLEWIKWNKFSIQKKIDGISAKIHKTEESKRKKNSFICRNVRVWKWNGKRHTKKLYQFRMDDNGALLHSYIISNCQFWRISLAKKIEFFFHSFSYILFVENSKRKKLTKWSRHWRMKNSETCDEREKQLWQLVDRSYERKGTTIFFVSFTYIFIRMIFFSSFLLFHTKCKKSINFLVKCIRNLQIMAIHKHYF
jgi:hypothetical protein